MRRAKISKSFICTTAKPDHAGNHVHRRRFTFPEVLAAVRVTVADQDKARAVALRIWGGLLPAQFAELKRPQNGRRQFRLVA